MSVSKELLEDHPNQQQHPLSTPCFEDVYWDNDMDFEFPEEEYIEEPHTPLNQGIAMSENCPSPPRKTMKKKKRFVVSIGKDRMVTNLFLSTTPTIPNQLDHQALPICQELPPSDLVTESVTNEEIVVGEHAVEDDPNIQETDEPLTILKVLKGPLCKEVNHQEREWRQSISWEEMDQWLPLFRRHRDTREWIVMEEKQRLRRVQEYSGDQVRMNKRRRLKLHPLTLSSSCSSSDLL